MPVYKNGVKVVPPVLTAPIEVMIRAEGDLNPVLVKIEYDEDGLHFLNNWDMCSLREGDLIETSDSVLSSMHD